MSKIPGWCKYSIQGGKNFTRREDGILPLRTLRTQKRNKGAKIDSETYLDYNKPFSSNGFWVGLRCEGRGFQEILGDGYQKECF